MKYSISVICQNEESCKYYSPSIAATVNKAANPIMYPDSLSHAVVNPV